MSLVAVAANLTIQETLFHKIFDGLSVINFQYKFVENYRFFRSTKTCGYPSKFHCLAVTDSEATKKQKITSRKTWRQLYVGLQLYTWVCYPKEKKWNGEPTKRESKYTKTTETYFSGNFLLTGYNYKAVSGSIIWQRAAEAHLWYCYDNYNIDNAFWREFVAMNRSLGIRYNPFCL